MGRVGTASSFGGSAFGRPRLSAVRRPGVWPNNLPQPLTGFVGRARSRDEALVALASTRFLTLSGAGGSGKTRLALELATAVGESFPSGAWWVELGPLAEGDQVAGALAGVLGARPLPGHTETQAAVESLADSQALVILDNCEHVLDAAADVCEAILRECPKVVILATSRVPLGVPGESDWRVPPMSVTDACDLFAARASRAYAPFKRDEVESTVARICRDLDGLPLAIELAAARARMLSVEQIADGLGDRFRLLTGRQRGVMPRHQTLRASMDWSHALLSDEQRMLFRRLAVFAGGWSLEAVEAACAGDGLEPTAILDLLASLADASLVVVEPGVRAARYRLLETVRQYADELLVESGEASGCRDRHLDFYAGLSERGASKVNTPESARWIEIMDADAANFQAAVDHAIGSRPDQALRIGVALTHKWRVAGQFAAGQRALATALDVADRSPSALRARALWSCGFLARYMGDAPNAARYVLESIQMAEAVEDGWTLAAGLIIFGGVQMFRNPAHASIGLERAQGLAGSQEDPWLQLMAHSILGRSYLLSDRFDEAEGVFAAADRLTDRIGVEAVTHSAFGLGWSALARGDFACCVELFEQAQSAARELGDSVTATLSDVALAQAELLQGRAADAFERASAAETMAVTSGAFMVVPSVRIEIACARAALGELEQAREQLEGVVVGGADAGWHECEALVVLGEVLRALGDPGRALGRAREGLEMAESVGVPSLKASAKELLAWLAIDDGQWAEADGLLHEALALRVEIGVSYWLPQTLDALARVAAGLESHTEAARLLGAADGARARLGLVRSSLHEPAVAEMHAALVVALGAARFAATHDEGAAMTLEEAVGWARRARGSRKRPSGGWESLTPTERQVVKLVVEGLTNPRIADRMFISRGTVKVHLEHVFQKLGVHSRSELAALAARRVS